MYRYVHGSGHHRRLYQSQMRWFCIDKFQYEYAYISFTYTHKQMYTYTHTYMYTYILTHVYMA